MHDEELEQPIRTASPRRKACWAIRKALRDTPGGLTTEQMLDRAREYWPGEPFFEGDRGWRTIRSAQIFLHRGGLIRPVNHA